MLNLCVLAVLALILYVVLQKLESKQKKLPPGPIRWPLIGNLIELALLDLKFFYKALMKLAAKYGEVMLIRTGVADIVVISGYEAIKEAFGTEAFLTRFSADDKIHQVRSFGKPLGIINSTGDLWYHTRRFTLRHLRDLGFAKLDVMNLYCAEEYEALTAFWETRMDSEKRVVVTPNSALKIPFANLVWRTMSSKRFEMEDPEGLALIDALDQVTKHSEFAGGIATAFPVLMDWFPGVMGKEAFTEQAEIVQKIVKKAIEEVKAKGRYKTSPENFIESFLQALDDHQDGDETGIFTDLNLTTTAIDLAWGAQDTLSATTGMFFRSMLFHPEVQQKMRDEINSVVGGPGSRVALEDKMRLHYCRAAILESQRLGNIAPMLGRQSWARETSFRGYTIPANASILLNTLTVTQDEAFWGDPVNYRPERFLNAKGEFVHSERVMSFGAGKRDCPGQTVAESGLFIYACNLVRDYAILPIPGHEYSMENVPALACIPKEYQVYFKKL